MSGPRAGEEHALLDRIIGQARGHLGSDGRRIAFLDFDTAFTLTDLGVVRDLARYTRPTEMWWLKKLGQYAPLPRMVSGHVIEIVPLSRQLADAVDEHGCHWYEIIPPARLVPA